jgi:peptidoglycan-associated lipoprotein
MRRTSLSLVAVFVALALVGACKKTPPVARLAPPPPSAFPGAPPAPNTPPPPPTVVPEPPSVPMEPAVTSTGIDSMAIDEINKNSPLKPIYFFYDSDTLDDAAKAAASDNAQILKRYATWVVTVEGHTDERGSAEYNLALGERRAMAAKAYMLSLGIAGDRLRTVSYGKEFPFDPGHDESAWKSNRRAHFMLTSK